MNLADEFSESSEDEEDADEERDPIAVGIPVVAGQVGLEFDGAWFDGACNALAVVREFGPPDMMITMTCNPEWPEIVDSIPVGARAMDYPAVCARAFKVRLYV